MEFIGALANSLQAPQHQDTTPVHSREALRPAAMIARDENTGAPQLRIPLPDPETAGKIADMLTFFGDAMRAMSAGPRK